MFSEYLDVADWTFRETRVSMRILFSRLELYQNGLYVSLSESNHDLSGDQVISHYRIGM